MKTSDFYYNLPQELIAQTPTYPRDISRLLSLNKENGKITHKHFYNINDYLNCGDTLVLNNTKVIPARLFGTKVDTGATIELLLLEQIETGVFETLVKPGKKAKENTVINFSDGLLIGTIIRVLNNGNRVIEFNHKNDIFNILDKIGKMPLPPYITEKLEDSSRYQTVYSKVDGSSAAPTAGLHFTEELLEKIINMGVNVVYVTLHIGLGTFRPVKVDTIEEHIMHSEYFEIDEYAANIIKKTKQNGKKVIAVGTTSCRTLESMYYYNNDICASCGNTDIFIYPGKKFNVIDGLITNFHLPESTLIMLVSALAGYEHTMNAYSEAVKERYRFFSFGDAMFIL